MQAVDKAKGRRNRVFVALLSVLAIALPTVVLVLPAHAAAENPKVTASLVMTSAGTGYCSEEELVVGPDGKKTCPTQSFVNSQNGFIPGADSAAGGVVASGDYVSYLSTVDVAAGPARTVQVVYNFPDWLFFDPAQNAGLCVSDLAIKGTLLTTEPGPQAVCQYEAKAWQPATLQTTLFVTAGDTAGAVETGQVVSVSTRASAGDDYFATSNAKAVTVVSAPAADLLLRPDQCQVSGQCQALDASVSSSTLHVMVQPLSYPGWSSKGASTNTPWSASVDVSSFPPGTQWFLREVGADPSTRVPLTVVDGKVQIPSRSGPVELDYDTLVILDDDDKPDVGESWGGSDYFPPGGTKNFVAHIVPDPGAFDTPAFKNNGTGWEPGEGKPQDFNTQNQEGTGAREGYLTPNNDYTIAQVNKPPNGCKDNPALCFFGKGLFRPWNPSQTLWEEGNQKFKSEEYPGGGKSVSVGPHTAWGNTQGVTEGTQVDVHLVLQTKKIPQPSTSPEEPLFVVSDQWNPNEQKVTGPVQVVDPEGHPVTEGFRVEWSRVNGGEFDNSQCAAGTCGFDITLPDPANTSGWITSATPPEGARSVRVIFDNPSLPIGDDAGAGTFYVRIPMEILDIDSLDPLPAQFADRGNLWFDGRITSSQIVVAPVSTPIPTVGITVEAQPADVIDSEAYEIAYTIQPDISDLTSSVLPVSGQVTVTLDPCTYDVSLLGDQWEIVSLEYGTGCGIVDEDGNPVPTTRGTMVLQTKAPTSCPAGSECPAGSWIPSTMKNGVAQLPPIELQTNVSRLKTGYVDLHAAWQLTDRQTTNTVASEDVSVNVPATAEISEVLIAKTPVREVNDPLVWDAIVQGAKIDIDESTGLPLPSQALGTATVIALPTMNSAKNQQYVADFNDANPGAQYDGISQSDFHGTYTLTSAAVVAEDSVEETSLYCTTTADPSLDPTLDQNWVLAPEVDGVQTCTDPATTALKIVQTKGLHMGVSTVQITLQPVDNKMGDTYVMWIGPQQLGDGSAENPATIAGMAPPKEERIVSSDVTGAVYWDQSGNGSDYVPGNPLVDGVVVTLCMVGDGADQTKQVQDSAKDGADPTGSPCNSGDTKIAVTTTVSATEGNEPDYNYEFTGLHSGDYYTIIANYPTKVASKVDLNRMIDVEQTRSYKGQVLGNAKPVSTVFAVPEGTYSDSNDSFTAGLLPDVNFGFFAPDPYSDLAKSVSAVSCPEEDENDPTSNVCDITWQVEVVSSAVDQVPGTPVQISSNYANSAVLAANGDVYITGGNKFGQLGNGQIGTAHYLVPTKVDALSGLGVSKVSSAPSQGFIALTRYGEIYVWGINNSGVLGLGNTASQPSPVLVSGLPAIKDFAKYGRGTFLIDKSGNVYVAGGYDDYEYNFGTLGLGAGVVSQYTFTPVDALSNIVAMNANEAAAYAIDADGELWAWGSNDLGLLAGNAPTSPKTASACTSTIHGCTPTPQRVGKLGDERVIQVAAGRYATAAINAAGDLYVWGSNKDGMLGLGQTEVGFPCDYKEYGTTGPELTTFCAKTPQLMPRPEDGGTWSQVQMGWDSGLAMSSKGNLYSWGNSNYGVLGTGATGTQWTPTQVTLPDGLEPKEISLRAFTAVVQTTDNQVLSWGLNTNLTGTFDPPAEGAVGNGTTGNVATPVLMDPTWVTGSMTYDYANSLGSNQTLTGGTLTDTTSEQVYDVEAFIGQTVKSLTQSPGATLFLTNTGQVYQAGSNDNGQAGNGTHGDGQDIPVLAGWGPSDGVQGKIVQQLLTNGQAYTLTDEGKLYVTGTNQYGRWGLGKTANSGSYKYEPTLIDTFPAGVKIKQVGANIFTTYAVTTEGDVYAWGDGTLGSLGDGVDGGTATSPVKIEKLSNIKSVSGSEGFAVALSNDGDVYGWGQNAGGRILGECDISTSDPTKCTANTANPVTNITALWEGTASALPPLEEISAGGLVTVGRTARGDVYAWGYNNYGLQGNDLPVSPDCYADASDASMAYPPHRIKNLSGVTALATGKRSVLAMTADGQVYSWGENKTDQLGRPTAKDCTSTVEAIPTISGATGIVAYYSGFSSAAIVSGGVVAWGENLNGGLGVGTSTDPVPTPTPVVDTWNNQKITLTVKEITHSNGWVERVYDMPDIDPGESVTVTITGKVNRPGPGDPGGSMTGYTIGNQALYSSEQTPKAVPETPSLPGDPAPEGGQPAPGQPDGKPFNPAHPQAAGKWPHSTCDATPGWVVPGDQCDAVWASVPGSTLPVGSLSGRVWTIPDGESNPASASTTYVSSRDQLLGGVTATLYSGTPATPGTVDGLTKIGSVQTDSDGYYQFDNLLPASNYYVAFTRPPVTDGAGTWAFADPGTYSSSVDVSVANQVAGVTPAMTVVKDADTPNVDAGFWKTSAQIEVTKVGIMAGETIEDYRSEIDVPYSAEPAPVGGSSIRAFMENTGNEPLGNLTFGDSTIAGKVVEWTLCGIMEQPNTAEVVEGMSLPIVFPSDWVLEPGEHLACEGELAPFDAGEANGYHEDTITYTGTGTVSGAVLQDDSTFKQKTDPATLPVPKIALEKGVLVDANQDGTCPDGATKQALDGSCWQKNTLVVPGTSKNLTFRIWNTGTEDLTQLSLDDEILVGDATVTQQTQAGQRAASPVVCYDQDDNPVDSLAARTDDSEPYPFVDCKATLTFVGFQNHEDLATVMATGKVTGSLVQDDSNYTATVPFFIQKVGKVDGVVTPLDGVEWTLQNPDGTRTDVQPELCPSETGDPSEPGAASPACEAVGGAGLSGEVYALVGLAPGEYDLIETKAPEGFNLLPQPIKLTISESGELSVAGAGAELTFYPTDGTTKQYQIVTVSDVPFLGGLPLSGGPGWIFRIVIAMTLIGGFVLLDRRLRKTLATQENK